MNSVRIYGQALSRAQIKQLYAEACLHRYAKHCGQGLEEHNLVNK